MSLSAYAEEFSPTIMAKNTQKSLNHEAIDQESEIRDAKYFPPVKKLSKTFAAVTIADCPTQSTPFEATMNPQQKAPVINTRTTSRAVSQRPRAGQSVDVTLQSLLVETALAGRIIRKKPKNDSAKVCKHDTARAGKQKGPSTDRQQVKQTNNDQGNDFGVMTTRSGRKKMIVRPSDFNKKLSKLKQSVLDFRDEDEKPAEHELEKRAFDGDNISSIENAEVEETRPSCRPYEHLKLATDRDTVTEMEVLSTEMLSGLKAFQDRQYQRNEIKARARQRMYYGLKEAHKHIINSKVRMLLLARDLQPGPGSAGLDQLVDDLLDKAQANRVPVVCVLTRKKLQKLTHKPSKVACVAIVDPSGREQQFERLKQLSVVTTPLTGLDTRGQETLGHEQAFNDLTLKTWTSTTRRGRFEFAVDKLF